jgi:hypothetical protein
VDASSAGLRFAYRLPVEGWPQALFQSDFGYGAATLAIDGAEILRAGSRAELEQGVAGALPGGAPIAMQLVDRGGALAVEVIVDGQPAPREDRIWAKPSRSAWIHAVLALLASAAGFAASFVYLRKAEALQSPWALKMGQHTAGWHLLLTFTLFPASVWGQRLGIRVVQLVSLVFFLIHAGIALANANLDDTWIGFFNALSGLFFLASILYGQRAHRDMDPIAALRQGRI